MDRTNTAKPHLPPGSTRAEPSNTQLGLLVRKLDFLDEPRPPLRDAHACRAARVQAVQWFNRLDTSDQLDQLWPHFEEWLGRRPENLQMYLAVERTCWTLEEFRRWCPPEGPEAAQDLPRMSGETLQPPRIRVAASARRVAITTIFVMNLVALYLIAR